MLNKDIKSTILNISKGLKKIMSKEVKHKNDNLTKQRISIENLKKIFFRESNTNSRVEM